MASDKSTDFLKRNRPPRVNISYEDPYDSEKMVELPFVLGVMSDLSGNASEVEKPDMEERDFVDVTSATLDDYMKSIAPGLSFNVENKLGEVGHFLAGVTHIEWFSTLGESVTMVTGLIFVICVLAFRRGIMGEIIAWLVRRRGGTPKP